MDINGTVFSHFIYLDIFVDILVNLVNVLLKCLEFVSTGCVIPVIIIYPPF